jgi:S-adenosylmethionine hydrolase
MHILSFTTDLGSKDHYLASLKATALKLIPDVHIVDVSNHISAFDMAKAAFVLRNVWRDFPEGTVHILGVDSQWSKSTPYIFGLLQGHYFIGTDNGAFSLVFDGAEFDEIYAVSLTGDEDMSFPAKSIFVPVAARIFAGTPLNEIGVRRESYRKRQALVPVVEHDNIRGTVIYIDTYGNVITNITKKLFDEVVGNKPFNIVARRGDSDLSRISRTYSEVPEGEKVALFTSAGYLELAINFGVEGSGGGACDLLGLRENDVVRIEIES